MKNSEEQDLTPIANLSWHWTGFQGKTLWNWLELLIVPVLLGVGATVTSIFFDTQTEQRQLENIHQTELRQLDKNRQESLKEYISQMTIMLVDQNLDEQTRSSAQAHAARALTLTVLRELDGQRKRQIMQFLKEARLIENKKTILSLKEADLTNADLTNINLYNTNLNNINLERAILKNTNLYSARLIEANLKNTNLQGAYLKEAHLNSAELEGVTLRGADLRDADISGTDLGKVDLSKALYSEATEWPKGFDPKTNPELILIGPESNLSGLDLSHTKLIGANLQKANLSNTKLIEGIFFKTDFRGADLSKADLSGANLRYADLRGAKLSDAILNDTDLRNAYYSQDTRWPENFTPSQSARVYFIQPNSDLYRATFTIDLKEENLSGAILTMANMNHRDLTGINLTGADLRGANLQNANLQNALLVGTDLSNAKLQGAHLNQALYATVNTPRQTCFRYTNELNKPCATKFPKEFDPKKEGMKEIK